MSRAPTRLSIAFGALLVLAVVNLGIVGKERIRRDGEVVFLALAPVDPRALLQGDYMALRFGLVREIEAQQDVQGRPDGAVGFADVTLDAQRVAHLAAPASGAATLRLRYRIRAGRVWLGTNAWFFEEGTAARYADARYGEFRVDRASGEAVLVGLTGADLIAR